MKTCTQCGKEKPKTQFHARRKSPDGLRPNCKDCKRKVDAEHYAANQDKIKEKAKAWSSENTAKRKDIEARYRKTHRQQQNLRTINYRARKLAACEPEGWEVSPEWWLKVCAEYGFRCAYCGKPGKQTVEHIVPLNRGGKHSEANIVPACPSCNYSKADKTIEELGWKLRDKIPSPWEYGDIDIVSLRANVKAKASKLTVFEDQWRDNPDLIKAMVRWRFGKFEGISVRASECELSRIEGTPEGFFERNHLDGNVKAAYTFCLHYKGRLISALSIRKNFNGETEIARLATDYDYSVYGGAGRLVKAAKAFLGETPLYTFSNNRVGNGAVYQKLGFRLLQENPPSYFYTDGIKRYWRWQGRKNAASGMTEAEQASSGWLGEKLTGKRVVMYKVYDCGHRKWVL